MNKAIFASVVALTVLLLAAGATADMSEVIEWVSDSVVTVKAENRVGAGFIVSADGGVLSSAHLVGDADQVVLTMGDKSEVTAAVEKKDDERDLALLRLDRVNLPVVRFAGSGALKPGTKVAAVGSPLGLEGSVTEGVISAVEREINGKSYLQIDAALNEGNSGGPIIDDRGRVVGVATAVIKEAENVGFAIPSDVAIAFLQQAGIAVNVALGEGPTATATETQPVRQPSPGPRPPGPSRPVPAPASLLLLIGIPLVISLAVSLLVSLLVARSARTGLQQPVTLLPQQPPPEEEDLSDIDIMLH